ncbi:MAG: DUF3095 domain-containing protein [Betaproteobacteria bacterium]|nr:DUF3095 domain-containing protein [Betaproteobacteria bacterium]
MFADKITESALSTAAPDSSSVVIADVRGSTAAIQRGEQRLVNMVGAACIAAVRNNFPAGVIPYVFGGDGATFLVPDEHLAKLKDVLEAVQTMARVQFKLSVRVGEVRVSELRAQNTDVFVRTQDCGAEEKIYFLQGDGVSLADKLIKERDSHFDEMSSFLNFSKVNVAGLSCRLLPFNALRGSIYSFIIEPRLPLSESRGLFNHLFSVLAQDGHLEEFRPLQRENARRSWLPKTWRIEAGLKMTGNSWRERFSKFWESIKENILTTFVFRFDVQNAMTGRPSSYMQDMLVQSDWLKFNGSLYLIVDLKLAEYQRFVAELEHQETQGSLFFGVQRAESALVVCHLDSSSEKKHFHFVDGSEGGLTMAALQLKAKKR